MNELEKLREAVEALNHSPGWDWNSFVSTLVATLVGAAITGVVAVMVLRRQRRDRYEERMTDAARATLDAVLAYGDVRFSAGRDANDIRPAANRVVGEAAMMHALASGDDRVVTDAMQELANAIVLAPLTSSPREPLADLADSFSKFVARRMSAAEQKERLSKSVANVAAP